MGGKSQVAHPLRGGSRKFEEWGGAKMQNCFTEGVCESTSKPGGQGACPQEIWKNTTSETASGGF